MSFSLFQSAIPFHSVYNFLQLLSPNTSESADNWSTQETEQIKIGDLLFILTPVHSGFGDASAGIGVSEGDKFQVAGTIAIFREDAGYPMGLSITEDNYEMQFVETLLCVKAEGALSQKQGFYYVHCRPRKAPSQEQLAELAGMHKWGNNGSRKQPPKGLPDPMSVFLSSLGVASDPGLASLGELASGLLADEAGRGPNLKPHFEPLRRRKDLPDQPAAAAPKPAAGGGSLNSLLDFGGPSQNLGADKPANTLFSDSPSPKPKGGSLNSLLDLDSPSPSPASLDSLLDLNKPAPPAVEKPAASLDSLLDLSKPSPPAQKPKTASLDSLLDLTGPETKPAAPSSPSLDSLLDLSSPAPPKPSPAASGPSLDSLLDLGKPSAPAATGASLDALLDLGKPAPPAAPPTAPSGPSLDSLLDPGTPAAPASPTPSPSQGPSLDALLDLGGPAPPSTTSQGPSLDALLDLGKPSTPAPQEPAAPAASSGPSLDSLLDLGKPSTPAPQEPAAPAVSSGPSLDSLLDLGKPSTPAPQEPAAPAVSSGSSLDDLLGTGSPSSVTASAPALDSLLSPPTNAPSLDSLLNTPGTPSTPEVASPSSASPPEVPAPSLDSLLDSPASTASPSLDSLLDTPAGTLPPPPAPSLDSLLDAPATAPAVPSAPSLDSLLDAPAATAPAVPSAPSLDSLLDTPAPTAPAAVSAPTTITSTPQTEQPPNGGSKSTSDIEEALRPSMPPPPVPMKGFRGPQEDVSEFKIPLGSSRTEGTGLTDAQIAARSLENLFSPNEGATQAASATTDNSGFGALADELTVLSATPAEPAPIEAPPVVQAPAPVEIPPVDQTPAPVETPPVVQAPAPIETPPVDQAPAPVETPPVVQTPAPIEAPAVDQAPAPVETPPVDQAPPVETPAVQAPAPVEIPPVDQAPAPAETPVVQAPAPVETPPAVQTQAPVETPPTPSPIDTPPVVQTQAPIEPTPVLQTPAPIETPPVTRTGFESRFPQPAPIETPPVVQTPAPIETPPVVQTPSPIETPPVTRTGFESPFPQPAPTSATAPTNEAATPVTTAAPPPQVKQTGPIDPTTMGWTLTNPLPLPSREISPPEIRLPKDLSSLPGVGGLITKLEQQAQKAASRLEEKLGEVQTRLSTELTGNVRKITIKEEQSARNITSLKSVLSRKLKAAGDGVRAELTSCSQSTRDETSRFLDAAQAKCNEAQTSLSTTTMQELEKVAQLSTSLGSNVVTAMEKTQQEAITQMRQTLQASQNELATVQDSHKRRIQDKFDQSHASIKEIVQAHHSELQSCVARIDKELTQQHLNRIVHLDGLAQQMSEAITRTSASMLLELQKEADALASDQLLQRVSESKADLLKMAQQLREQLKKDLEQSSAFKFTEMEPILMRSRAELNLMLQEAEELQLSIQNNQKSEFDKTVAGSAEFIEEKIAEAKRLAEFSQNEMVALDRIIEELCDPSNVEADPELKDAGVAIITQLKKIGNELHDSVNESLRVQIANMEDKSRSFQEDLISNMEGNAFGVRKSIETGLSQVREALKAAFSKIQSTQDQYLS